MAKQIALKADEMLATIFEYMTKITAENDIDKIMSELADLGKKLVIADRCTVWLHKPTEQTLWTVIAQGMSEVTIDEHSGLVGYCLKKGEAVIVSDAYADDRFNKAIDLETGYRTRSVICIPFKNTDGKIIGVFQAVNKMTEDDAFNEKDYERLTLVASYAGTALETSILRNELIATQREIIETMGEIGESRSQETGNHVKRVAKYSYRLALLSGFSEVDAMQLKLASPMHDIGKVAIPDSVLLKPGKLTDEEFEIMKGHSTIGYNVFKHSHRELLRVAAIIAHEHHERWDGKGYPNGLAGNGIHIVGRITAIADVFDALGAERVYKKAWPIDKILSYMKEQRGKQFDPGLIDLFIANIDQFIAIRDEFYDVK